VGCPAGFPLARNPTPIVHVSASPPLIPDSRISRVRLAAAAFPRRTFPHRPRLKRTPAYTPDQFSYTSDSTFDHPFTLCFRFCVRTVGADTPATYREPLCTRQALPPWWRHHHRLGRRYPALLAPTGSCVGPESSCRTRSSLRRLVFAGCCASLLEAGPSRRYLRSPCTGAWTLTPPHSTGALTRFFPADIGLTSTLTGSACEISPRRGFSAGTAISRLQSFRHVQAPVLARPSDRAHHGICPRAAGPFTPRNGRGVTLLELWHRYVSEPGN
jgi:hypothetical protein